MDTKIFVILGPRSCKPETVKKMASHPGRFQTHRSLDKDGGTGRCRESRPKGLPVLRQWFWI
ncbi:MAG: hypothetical protein JEZ11_23360 [Desulfobacterales bacterium]|nr:hypothetical protein [Desulfobacterales bacterium]